MENLNLNIDDVQYTFRPGNFLESKKQALNLMAILKGGVSTKPNDGQSSIDIDLGAILANLGSPEMQGIENFVLKYLDADVDGKKILLRNVADVESHFNKYRSHYFEIMFEGFKYHFLPFLPSGLGSSLNMNLSQTVQALAQ